MSDQPAAARNQPRAPLLRSTRVALGRMAATVAIAVLVIVPDSEIAAKLFKVGLILVNVHQRATGST